MELTGLTIENFLSIGKAFVQLSNRGLVLVQGVNTDDPSADSNGSGKSSLVDAIEWVIYGETARGVSADKVVNRVAGKDCFVQINIKDGKDKYEIVRHRKHSVMKNSLTVKLECEDGTYVALTKGTERETQEVVEKIIGCSRDVFMSAIYAAQERMPNLPAMTDKQLKTTIEQAAGVEILSEAYVKASSIANESASELARTNSALFALKASLEESVKDLALTTKLVDEWDSAIASLRATLTTELSSLTDEIGECLKEAAKLPSKIVTEAALASAMTAVLSLKSETDKHQELQETVSLAKTKFAVCSSKATALKKIYDERVLAVKNIEAKVGAPCGECGKGYCEHDIAKAKEIASERVEEAKEALITQMTEFKVIKENLATGEAEAKAYTESMTDSTALGLKQTELSRVHAEILRFESDETALKTKVSNLRKSYEMRTKEENPYLKMIELTKAKILGVKSAISDTESKVEAAEVGLQIARGAQSVFGPAGVRAHILDTVTPQLNERTAYYLGALADGNIQAVWTTLTANAKGELREKFSVSVTNAKGADDFAGLSGGEKRKVRLACAMALQDLVASRASKPINIFIADEIESALDETGLERLMTILNEKAKDKGTVLVISHSDLKDWVDTVMTVTKAGGMATVGGDTTSF